MKKGVIVVLIVAFASLLSLAYIANKSTDQECENSENKNVCCEQLYANEPTISCVGKWEYLENNECRFVCSFDNQACTKDLKICPDGSYVARDPSNFCQFSPCREQ